MNAWRLLDAGALPPSLNMAVDEALLAFHARGRSPPTLRFYGWRPPAVSLGYFQRSHSIDLAACRHRGLAVVRRPTGGRAVLHLNDLTYSIVGGAMDGVPSSLAAAYRRLCEGLLSGFRLMGIEAELGRKGTSSAEEDICFLREAIGDLVFRGRKFLGNAQTWSGSSMLQHGSITLRPQRETWAMILAPGSLSGETLCEMLRAGTTSVEEILGRDVEPDEVKRALAEGFARALGADFREGDLTAEEWALAREKCAGRDLGEKACEPIVPLRPTRAGMT